MLWKTTLGLENVETDRIDGAAVRKAFNERAHTEHTDKGGTADRFASLLEAKEQAEKWLASKIPPKTHMGMVRRTNKVAPHPAWDIVALLPPDYEVTESEKYRIKSGNAVILPWPSSNGVPANWDSELELLTSISGAPTAIRVRDRNIAVNEGFPPEICG